MNLIILKYLKLHFSGFFSLISLHEVYFGETSKLNLDRKITQFKKELVKKHYVPKQYHVSLMWKIIEISDLGTYISPGMCLSSCNFGF